MSSPSERLAPITLQALRESQRQLWKQKCTSCGADAGATSIEHRLRARVRELEWRLKELEAQLSGRRSGRSAAPREDAHR